MKYNNYKMRVIKNSDAAKVNILDLKEDVQGLKDLKLHVKEEELPQKKKKNGKDNKQEDKKVADPPQKKIVMEQELKEMNKQIQVSQYMPPDPDHFEVYPSIIPKDKKTRLNHRKIVEDIEDKYMNGKGGKL